MTEPPPAVPEESRPALRLAATLYLDDILHCHVEGTAEYSMAIDALPPNFRLRIEKDLYRWSVAFSVAGTKLAREEPLPPACVAECLAMWAVLDLAAGILEDGPDFGLRIQVPEDEALEWREGVLDAIFPDTDFLFLYEGFADGIGAYPDEPVAKAMRMVNLAYADWFRPFDGCEGHPYFDEGDGMEAGGDD